MFSELFISRIRINDTIPSDNYISSLPVVRNIIAKGGLELTKPVTFFMGENGVGKSTLIEAVAIAAGFNPEGGTRNFTFSTEDSHSELYKHITLTRGVRPQKDGFFLRAESFYNVATDIDRMDEEPSFSPRLIESYGGISLHEQSHGESFLALVENRFGGNGLYILDEPEAALSPMRLMNLMIDMKDLVEKGSQFIISTHSPILIAFPDSEVFELMEDSIESVPYYETEHFRVTKQFLNTPERMLKYLFE